MKKIFLKKFVGVLIVVTVTAGIVFYFFPREVEKVVEVERGQTYPVLDRIAKCESGNKHFGESGQVLMIGNTNKSVDVGRYQINVSIWGKKATEMHLDLTLEEDNKKFAEYLYKNYGTEPWIYSKQCWNK